MAIKSKHSICIINSPPGWLKTPPLSLVYLQSHLKKMRCSSEIIDLNMDLFKILPFSAKEWLTLNKKLENRLFSIIKRKAPALLENMFKKAANADFIGFSISGRNVNFSFSLAETLSEKFPGKKIIFGGPHTLFLKKEKNLNSKYQWVIGEGETPVYEILKGNTEKIIEFKETADLDTLAFPDFSSLSLYSSHIPLLSSRGCMYNCNFCSEKLLYRKFRNHSPLYMADQIKYLAEKHKTNNFVFCDSLINYSGEWLENFCSLIIKKNLNIKWEAQARINQNITPELARLMKKSGCYNLFVGLESASDDTLKFLNKGITSEAAYNFFKKLSKAGMHFEISLILGHPRETEKDFNKTVAFIIKNKGIIPKIAQVNPFTDYLNAFPGRKFPTETAKERIMKFMEIIQTNKIRHTKSFINNLIYSETNDCSCRN